jgi:hypothetical protein
MTDIVCSCTLAEAQLVAEYLNHLHIILFENNI